MADPAKRPSLDELRKQIREWWDIIVSVSAGVAAILGDKLGLSEALQGIAIALTITTVFVLVVRRYVRSTSPAPKFPESDNGHLVAFRGLLEFSPSDTLPGTKRRLDAARLLAHVGGSSRRLTLVYGPTGCGKTSLLRSEFQQRASSRGFTVSYISDPKSLPSGSEAHIQECVKKSRESDSATVVIFDQFESSVMSRDHIAQQKAMARGIYQSLEAHPDLHIILSMRNDYVGELHHISHELPNPLDDGVRFYIDHPDVNEAKEIILECASADGVPCSPDLAAAIAADLASPHGQVRLAELQIVCSYLAGEMTVDNYRKNGLSVGILSSHIKNIAGTTPDPHTTRRILRSLCDFGWMAKSAPKSAEAIRDELAPGGVVSVDTCLMTLGILQSERVVSCDDTEARRWSLSHDYLVAPIKQATQNQSTTREEADALLKSYLLEERGRGTRSIPAKHALQIQKHASLALKSTPQARRLLRRGLLGAFCAPLLLITAGGLIATASSASDSWELVWAHPQSRYFSATSAGFPATIHTTASPYIFTKNPSTAAKGGNIITAWSTSTGRPSRFWKADIASAHEGKLFLAEEHESQNVLRVIDIGSWESISVPFSSRFPIKRSSIFGQGATLRGGIKFALIGGYEKGSRNQIFAAIDYSSKNPGVEYEWNLDAEVRVLSGQGFPKIVDKAAGVVTPMPGRQGDIAFVPFSSESAHVLARRTPSHAVYYEVLGGRDVAILEAVDNGIRVQLWDALDSQGRETVLKTDRLASEEEWQGHMGRLEIAEVNGGDLLHVSDFASSYCWVLDRNTLEVVYGGLSPTLFRCVRDHDSGEVAFLSQDRQGAVAFFLPRQERSLPLQGLNIDDVYTFIAVRSADRAAAITRSHTEARFWKLSTGELLASVPVDAGASAYVSLENPVLVVSSDVSSGSVLLSLNGDNLGSHPEFGEAGSFTMSRTCGHTMVWSRAGRAMRFERRRRLLGGLIEYQIDGCG